ncbi:hypothetical protein [Paenibacillus sp. FSL R7-0652]|uniref:BrnT family toxin n=1 Tax=Paenibacillus sp. FSL R7-0652 TaxID=2921687 RepID=UPI00315B0F53
MQLPKHQFVIENQANLSEHLIDSYSWDSYGNLRKHGLDLEEQAVFEDEFIAYIYDSLNWLVTWNPGTEVQSEGLNLHGVTVIAGQETLSKLHQVLKCWAELFSNAPDSVVLTGNYCIDGEKGVGYSEKLVYNKSDLIKELNKLVAMTRHAQADEACIVHFGI